MKRILILLFVIISTSCSVENKIDRKENIKTVGRIVGTGVALVITKNAVTKIADDCKSCK